MNLYTIIMPTLLLVLLLLALSIVDYKVKPQAKTLPAHIRKRLEALKASFISSFKGWSSKKFKIEEITLNYKQDEESDYVYDLTLHFVNRSSETENLFVSLKVNNDFVKIKPKRLPLNPAGANKFWSGPFEIKVLMGEAEKDKTFYEKLLFTLDIIKIT